jgi:SAM-dependent methyltransferase
MNEHFLARVCCPACDSPEGAELVRAPLTAPPLKEYLLSFYSEQGGVELDYLREQDFVLTECPACGLVYQKEIPGDLVTRKLYEQWINPYRVFETVEKFRPLGYFSGLYKEIVGVVRHFGREPGRLEILDFGMGWGHWCRMAQALGCSVWGTELSEARIAYAKRTGVRVIAYEEIAELRFDFINAEQVFEHLPDPRPTLLHIAGSLKPGGILKIGVPDGGDIRRKLDTWNWGAPKSSRDSLNPVAPLEHLNCFSVDSLLRLGRECSLAPVELKIRRGKLEVLKGTVAGVLERLGHWRSARRDELPRGLCLFFAAAGPTARESQTQGRSDP